MTPSQSTFTSPSAPVPGLRGCWAPDPNRTPDELARAFDAALRDGATVLKESRTIRVLRLRLFGEDTLAKVYRLPTPLLRLKYLFRASRAARAWSAAQALIARGLATPAPLGLLERRQGLWPAESIYFSRYIDGALDAQQWLGRHYAAWTPDQRARAARMLEDYLLAFYRNGMCHGDTKASNILVERDAPPEQAPRLMAIDLECVDPRHGATRHRVVRNLVQLDGVLVQVMDPADRRRFFERMAETYPWLRSSAVQRKINAWTERRKVPKRRRLCAC